MQAAFSSETLRVQPFYFWGGGGGGGGGGEGGKKHATQVHRPNKKNARTYSGLEKSSGVDIVNFISLLL